MNCEDFSEPIKSCIWLDFLQDTIPLGFLTSRKAHNHRIFNLKIAFIEKELDLFIVKDEESSFIRVAVFQYPLKSNENLDDGYALKFYFTISGFNEKTQSAVMKYGDSQVGAFFKLTKDILKKAINTHFVFHVFVVIQMLEFKSLDKTDSRKIHVDNYISRVKNGLKTKTKIKQLGYILKNPKLEDVFTGRLPALHMKIVEFAITKISEHLRKLAEYFKAKYADKHFQAPDFEENKLFSYLGMTDKEGPVPLFKALCAYRIAHSIGLDCLKTAASSYLEYMLDKTDNIMHILAIALAFHDEDLIEISIIYFVDRLHEIKRSENFKALCVVDASTVRLIVHSSIVWMKNNGIHKGNRLQYCLSSISAENMCFPGWGQTELPTTEL